MSAFDPNKGQKRAIGAPANRPVRVVAGAGTGKTEVISRRFIHLLEQQPDLRPAQILVLTFSEKAAAEMRARIFTAVTQASLGYSRLDLAAAPISNFHSFGMRLLGDYSLRASLDAELPLLTDVEADEVLDAAQQTFLADGFKAAYGAFDPLESDAYDWMGDSPFALARTIFSQLRNQALSPAEFKSLLAAAPSDSERRRVLAPLVHWLYDAFLERLAERGQLDFDRIVTDATWLLEGDAELRERLRAQYRYVLVDEYQDTNSAQERLLIALAASGLSDVTVVGDPRQAIYVWREARVENIARFSAPPAKRFEAPLTENRRSLAPILSAANRAIRGYEFGKPAEFSAVDELLPTAEHSEFNGAVVSLYAAPAREEEAGAIVAWIQQLVAGGVHYRDIAILVRARTFLQVYVDALDAAGIPAELSSEDAFYTRPEILDAIHLLRVCVNPADELSLARALLSPAAGLTQAQVAGFKQARRGALWKQVRNPAAWDLSDDGRQRLSRFVGIWEEAQRQQWQISPAAFVGWVIHRAGLDGTADAPGLRALQKLCAVAHGYEADHPGASLRDVADYLRRVLDGDPRAKAPELTSGEDAVRVMTAHASKGLEFPVVIAADSRQRLAPRSSKQPFHEPDEGLVFPEDDDDDPRYLERVRHQRNEARCLWYVTLTRAQRRLIITAPNNEGLTGGQFPKVKTFFEELWNREAEEPSDGVELCAAPPARRAMSGRAPAAAPDGRREAGLELQARLLARLRANPAG